ncbi:MAG: hypothetical protein U0165_11570 [Polyangiaceae bacterium]
MRSGATVRVLESTVDGALSWALPKMERKRGILRGHPAHVLITSD